MSWQKEVDREGIEFLGSFQQARDMPTLPGLPEVTLAGRSNVGKSSALNTLSGRKKKVAVTSKTPGRTRLLNLFRAGRACALTDLPGYGFAKVSDGLQDEWRKSVEAYLTGREALKLAVLFVDARRDPQETDAQLLDFLEAQRLRALVVATKSDTLSKRELEASLQRLRESLALPDDQPLALSSKTGAGRNALWTRIQQMCCSERSE